MPELKTLVIEQEGAIDWVTLNRPERLNAITATMISELYAYFSALEADLSRRVVVLRGAGGAFCSGMDIKARQDKSDRPTLVDRYKPEPSLSGIVRLMRRCPQPIIALVHGAACGGGLSFALASDVRIAGASARMNDAYIRLGLSGCELGLSYFLPRSVGLSVASELMLTGNFISAERARAVGLVSDIVPDDQLEGTGRKLAQDMLRASPMGLRRTKETLNFAMRLSDLDAVLDLEENTQRACMQSGDFKEALAAFVEKRAPRFSG